MDRSPELRSEFLLVARDVLKRERRPLTAKQIVNVALDDALFSDKIAGRTPHQTMKSKLSVHIRRYGHRSIFVRTKPGYFFLRALLVKGQQPYLAPPLRPSLATEEVLVFRSNWLDSTRRFQGIKRSWKRFTKQLMSEGVCSYLNRHPAELTSEYKQVLTYIMVTHRGKVLAYRRGNYNRVEDYLKGSECIGFGGHVSSEDLDLFSASDAGIRQSAVRELSEELALPCADLELLQAGKGLKCVGILNDDSSSVGQRHFAFLYLYETTADPAWESPQRGEKSITQLRWISPSDKSSMPIWRFEYWSQLCLREYFPNLVNADSAFVVHRSRLLRPPHILCVIGGLGSGKSELTRLLCSEFGYSEVNSGKVLASILRVPPVPETARAEFQVLAWQFITSSAGPAILAGELAKHALAFGSDRVLIDGIRQTATLQALKGAAKGIRVGALYVHTLPDLAYRLYKSREHKDMSIFDFLAVRNAEVETEVERFFGIADAVIYNWIGLNAYKQTARKLMRQLTGKDEGR